MLSRRLLLSTVLAAATLPSTVYADEPIKVVATFSILGDMVNAIGGDAIELTTLVGPDGDAHVYQPTPQAAKAVSEADVLILNGLEFEGWLERLTEAASFDGKLVVATTGIDAIPFAEHDEDHDDHAEHGHDDHGDDHASHKDHDHSEHKHDDHDHAEHKHDEDHAGHDDHDHETQASHDDHDHEKHAGQDDHAGHDHGEFDPHAWQSIDNAMIYVDNIANGLAQADPDNASTFFTNRESYVAQLETLEAEIDAMMDTLPAEKRTVVTSHDAFRYFAQAYGLTFEAPQGLSTESEASAGDVAGLITQIREESISAVFVESITDNRLMEQIANETGAVIGGTLYSDALSDADGPASTYLEMMRYNAATISQALGS
ncbi:MAG: metal ABC transporter substrate-binding protein [Pseudomonadota bacterium]